MYQMPALLIAKEVLNASPMLNRMANLQLECVKVPKIMELHHLADARGFSSTPPKDFKIILTNH